MSNMSTRTWMGVGRGGVRPLIQAAADLICDWQRRGMERRELARLSERELRDFGLSRGEAHTESCKPFWRV